MAVRNSASEAKPQGKREAGGIYGRIGKASVHSGKNFIPSCFGRLRKSMRAGWSPAPRKTGRSVNRALDAIKEVGGMRMENVRKSPQAKIEREIWKGTTNTHCDHPFFSEELASTIFHCRGRLHPAGVLGSRPAV